MLVSESIAADDRVCQDQSVEKGRGWMRLEAGKPCADRPRRRPRILENELLSFA